MCVSTACVCSGEVLCVAERARRCVGCHPLTYPLSFTSCLSCTHTCTPPLRTSLTFPLPSLLPRSYHSPLSPPLNSLFNPSLSHPPLSLYLPFLSISTSLFHLSFPPLPSLLPRFYPISRGQIPYLGSQRRTMLQDKENYRKR
jgi:hypothetical protein